MYTSVSEDRSTVLYTKSGAQENQLSSSATTKTILRLHRPRARQKSKQPNADRVGIAHTALNFFPDRPSVGVGLMFRHSTADLMYEYVHRHGAVQ